jgi:hypothetical protein
MYFGSFGAFSLKRQNMLLPECIKIIFLKITDSPTFSTTLTTGPSLPIIKTYLSWSFCSKTKPFLRIGCEIKYTPSDK